MKSMDDQLKDLEKAFRQYAINSDDATAKGITAACIVVQRDAVMLSPVDTGLLRKSIKYRLRKERGEVIGEVGTNVEYAPFQEFGTFKMKPQPFLTPALEMNKPKIQFLLAKAIGDIKV